MTPLPGGEDRDPLEEKQAGDVPIGGVRIGKLPADVAGADGAQDRITDGVDQDVGVGMAQESQFKRDPRPAEDKLSARRKTVAVITETDAHRTLLKSVKGTRFHCIGPIDRAVNRPSHRKSGGR